MSPLPFVVPFGREGAADRAARIFSLSPGRGPGRGSLLIENLPGAGGLAGVRRANELARAGGSVLLLGTPTTHILLPERVGEGPDDSIVPWIGLGTAPNVLLVSPLLGARSVAELVAAARARPLIYASAGAGQTIHLCTALFCAQAGITMRHRPYDGGSATAYADLVAGTVQVYFDSLLGCLDRVAAGDAVPLAVSSAQRAAVLPDVPTLIECGFPDHALDVWLGVFASGSAGDPLPPDARLGDDLAALGLRGGPIGAAAFASVISESRPRWLRALDAARAV